MKRSLLLLLSVLTISSVSAQMTWGVKAGMNNSTTSIGVKDLSLTISHGNKIGFYAGIVNNFELGGAFGMQTELLYNYGGLRMSAGSDITSAIGDLLGYELAFDKASIAMNRHTLQLPILVTYNILDNLSVMAGPYLSLRVGNSVSLNNDFKDAMLGDGGDEAEKAFDKTMDVAGDLLKDNVKGFDIGASLGAEYRFNNGLFVDFRYTFSFMNKIKSDLDLSAIDTETEDMNYDDAIGITPRAKSSAIQFGLGYRF